MTPPIAVLWRAFEDAAGFARDVLAAVPDAACRIGVDTDGYGWVEVVAEGVELKRDPSGLTTIKTPDGWVRIVREGNPIGLFVRCVNETRERTECG